MTKSEEFAPFLTPDWLTATLSKNGRLTRGRVVSIDIEKIGGEFGFLDCLVRVTPTYERDEATAPRSLVVKVSAADATYRQIGDFYNAYQREFGFYESVAPHSPIRLPKCFGREMDLESQAHILILEDLAWMTPGDQVAGLTPKQAGDAIETIGRFHAAWWESTALASLTWMPSRNIQPARYQAAWPKFRDVVGPHLSSRAIALGERLQLQLEKLLGDLERRPHTIVHSDFRADNLLFDPTSHNHPVVVVDWQLAIRGRGILDVARLLCGSMNSADRIASETALLKRWHEALLRGGVTNYSFAEALSDYRNSALLCVYYPVTIHEAEEVAGNRGKALAHAQIERFFRAASDLSPS